MTENLDVPTLFALRQKAIDEIEVAKARAEEAADQVSRRIVEIVSPVLESMTIVPEFPYTCRRTSAYFNTNSHEEVCIVMEVLRHKTPPPNSDSLVVAMGSLDPDVAPEGFERLAESLSKLLGDVPIMLKIATLYYPPEEDAMWGGCVSYFRSTKATTQTATCDAPVIMTQ